MKRIQHLVPLSDGSDDFVQVLGPAERSRVVVGLSDVPVDGCPERHERVEHASLEALLGQLGEKASEIAKRFARLDGVQPKGRSRREVNGDARVAASATTRSAIYGASGGIRDGRVLSPSSPSTPSSMKRSCQRQTAVLATPARRHDLRRAAAFAGQQRNPKPPGVLLRAVAIDRDSGKPLAVGGGNVDDDTGAPASDSHVTPNRGNPKWTQPSDFIHYTLGVMH